MPLTLTSCQASEADPFWQALADFLSRHLPEPVVFVHDPSWQTRLQALADGAVDIGWVFGSYYIKFMARPNPAI
jgi:ABC-type nitrate/sulfonate/bicarbonate transport system substrate-binding protein